MSEYKGHAIFRQDEKPYFCRFQEFWHVVLDVAAIVC